MQLGINTKRLLWRWLYNLLLYLVLPLLWLRLLWRGRKNPAYWQRWSERFGWRSVVKSTTPYLWLHAVSVGEVIAAVPLVKALQQAYPHLPLLVTTMTPTGSERVKALLPEVSHCYAPYDYLGAWRRFFKRVKPCLLILMETELWPNLLQACQQRDVPVVLANARLSAKSVSAYRRLPVMTQAMIQSLHIILAQSALDAQRFSQLGASAEQIKIVGNLKYDSDLAATLVAKAKIMREQWQHAAVWIAASTHPGEEALILQAFQQIRQTLPKLLLILAPRHPDRAAEILTLCSAYAYMVERYSLKPVITAATDILLLDTIGDLLLFYGTADVALVGGSLVPHGGHNLLEPAKWGVPIITGTHMDNFQAMTEQLTHVNGIYQVTNVRQLTEAVLTLLTDHQQAQAMAQRAKQVLQQQAGSLQHHLDVLALLLPKT